MTGKINNQRSIEYPFYEMTSVQPVHRACYTVVHLRRLQLPELSLLNEYDSVALGPSNGSRGSNYHQCDGWSQITTNYFLHIKEIMLQCHGTFLSFVHLPRCK
jgi:hypothetical protein